MPRSRMQGAKKVEKVEFYRRRSRQGVATTGVHLGSDATVDAASPDTISVNPLLSSE